LSEAGKIVLKRSEVLSFGATAVSMLISIIFFPGDYWLFILLIFLDGLATSFKSERAVIADRILFALFLLILGSIALGFDILGMILETAVVIAVIDFLFLIRRMWTQSARDFFVIVSYRLRSYIYTLIPAVVFSAGLTYIGSALIGTNLGPANAILELGIASIAVFLIILFAARPPENLK
jgi:hypothetical protein